MNKVIEEYVELTGADIYFQDGKWHICTFEDTYDYDSFSDMIEDMKITISELDKEGVVC